ncbi:vWA domain-containing protein [Phycisphaera mikurensis]|uniref:VWFA domain-containing protein n=1 Tax=Phycisphaera mikurensis (strain NBRC 102666 / KCTC 22515 / FYK2301M01) TaxID=1142394 RepID=I0IDM8_PHYMF|nr:vWA domain-containing protein [Phycisphaera mikurensis]MBB6441185.1 hypothetical protein [Phycisphaera mikurensis]BAM03366.1 hypothetical protein PSMK_12070 [Phycisphaera mikurensis NBRC 102666]
MAEPLETLLRLPEGVTLAPALPPAAIAAGLGIGLVWVAAVAVQALRSGGLGAGRSAVIVVEWLARSALLLGLAALALNPQEMTGGSGEARRPEVLLVVDRSGSMATKDAADGKSRAAFVEEAWVGPLAGGGEAWARGARVSVVGFDQRIREEGDAEDAGDTSLIAAMDAALASAPAAIADDPLGAPAVVLLSDGRETIAPDPEGAVLSPALRERLQRAKTRGLAVHTVTVGEAAPPPFDLAVSVAPTTAFWIAGEPGAAEVTLSATRAAAAGTSSTVRVTGRADGEAGESAEEVLLYEADLRADRSLLQTLPVPVPLEALRAMGALRPKPDGRLERAEGVTGVRLAVSLVPVDGEAAEANNRQEVRVPLAPVRLRVLVLEGQPYWDTKFIAQALRADAAVAVEQVTRVTEGRWERLRSGADAGGTAGPPTASAADDPSPEDAVQRLDFSAFEVVMLGRRLDDVLSAGQWAALAGWVEGGGHLVLTRGRPAALSTPAASRLDPVVAGAGTATGAGTTLVEGADGADGVFGATAAAAVRAAPPPLRWLERGLSPKPATRVLLRAADDPAAPALVAMPVGRGSVLAVLGEGLWRWALPDATSLGGPSETRARYDALWAGLVRGLLFGSADADGGSSSSALRLAMPDGPATPGEEVRIGLLLGPGVEPAAARVEVTPPSGRVTRLRPATDVSAAGESADRDGLSLSFKPEEPGLHTVRGWAGDGDGEQEPVVRLLNVRPLGLERTLVSADAAAMREIAARTGGEVLDPADPRSLIDHLDDVAISRTRPPRPEPLWDTGSVLAGLLGIWSALWIARKAAGLP